MTANQRKQLIKAVNQIVKTLPIGEEIYLETLFPRWRGYVIRDEINKSKNIWVSYPMPTPTLEAARTSVVALYP